jgi:hypothetical protein
MSRGGNLYASAVLGLGVRDSTAGYRCYSADVLRRLDLERVRAEGYGFQIEMTYRVKQHGAAITEVPISFVDRAAGQSKMSSFIVVEALGLVTWWGMGRLVHGARARLRGGAGGSGGAGRLGGGRRGTRATMSLNGKTANQGVAPTGGGPADGPTHGAAGEGEGAGAGAGSDDAVRSA